MIVSHGVLTPSQLKVLRLLIIGDTRRAIASALFLSMRAVDHRVAELKRALQAADRWCMGVRAIRLAYIEREHPIAYAMVRRPGVDWVRPSARQAVILDLRSSGAALDQITDRLRISSRTVRLEIARLVADNGARNDTSAAALFEALGWTNPT